MLRVHCERTAGLYEAFLAPTACSSCIYCVPVARLQHICCVFIARFLRARGLLAVRSGAYGMLAVDCAMCFLRIDCVFAARSLRSCSEFAVYSPRGSCV